MPQQIEPVLEPWMQDFVNAVTAVQCIEGREAKKLIKAFKKMEPTQVTTSMFNVEHQYGPMSDGYMYSLLTNVTNPKDVTVFRRRVDSTL